MKFILGKKKGMTQIYNAAGDVHPVTVIEAGPVVVTQVKTVDKDGYTSVQIGFGTRKATRIAKAQKGHFKELGSFSHVREFRTEGDAAFKVGDKIDTSIFAEGDKVTITGTSKGKGFQGVVKRHGFAGGSRTHGQKHSEREPGTIGGGLRTRVPSGMRMAGRMGSDTITVPNLKVVQVNPASNLLLIEGAVPGVPGSLVLIKSVKPKAKAKSK